jgi:hypothetical protein
VQGWSTLAGYHSLHMPLCCALRWMMYMQLIASSLTTMVKDSAMHKYVALVKVSNKTCTTCIILLGATLHVCLCPTCILLMFVQDRLGSHPVLKHRTILRPTC